MQVYMFLAKVSTFTLPLHFAENGHIFVSKSVQILHSHIFPIALFLHEMAASREGFLQFLPKLHFSFTFCPILMRKICNRPHTPTN